MAVSFYTTFPNETVYTYELQDIVVNAPVSQLQAPVYCINQDYLYLKKLTLGYLC